MESMGFEVLVLVALIIIFIASFCGLLQKIRQTYERERQIVSERARITQETYANPAFIIEVDNSTDFVSVMPNAPPHYTELFFDPPPKYEDVVKSEPVSGQHVTRDMSNSQAT